MQTSSALAWRRWVYRSGRLFCDRTTEANQRHVVSVGRSLVWEEWSSDICQSQKTYWDRLSRNNHWFCCLSSKMRNGCRLDENQLKKEVSALLKHIVSACDVGTANEKTVARAWHGQGYFYYNHLHNDLLELQILKLYTGHAVFCSRIIATLPLNMSRVMARGACRMCSLSNPSLYRLLMSSNFAIFPMERLCQPDSSLIFL